MRKPSQVLEQASKLYDNVVITVYLSIFKKESKGNSKRQERMEIWEALSDTEYFHPRSYSLYTFPERQNVQVSPF